MFFFSEQHILTTILFTPLLGALALLLLPQGHGDLQRKVANAFGLLGLIVSLPLLWKFKTASAEPFHFIADAIGFRRSGCTFDSGWTD